MISMKTVLNIWQWVLTLIDKEYPEGELASDNRAYHVPNKCDATGLVRKSQNVQSLQWILKYQDVYFQTQLGDFPRTIQLLL